MKLTDQNWINHLPHPKLTAEVAHSEWHETIRMSLQLIIPTLSRTGVQMNCLFSRRLHHKIELVRVPRRILNIHWDVPRRLIELRRHNSA
jgi:hypothetical protein